MLARSIAVNRNLSFYKTPSNDEGGEIFSLFYVLSCTSERRRKVYTLSYTRRREIINF